MPRRADRTITPAKRRHRPTTRRLLLLAAGGLLLLVVAVMAGQGLTARRALTQAQQDAATLARQLTQGQVAGARSTTKDLRAHTDLARRRTDGPLWAAAGHLPVVGTTVDAFSETVSALDRVADQTLPPAVDLTAALSDVSIQDGRLPLAPLRANATSMAHAASAADRADDAVARFDPDDVLGAARPIFTKAQQQLHDLRSAVDSAATALDLLPDMLGGQGHRRYLLVFQNNAESRATGGIFGSWAVLDARDGKLTLGVQGGAGDIGRQQRPIIPLQPQEATLYGNDLGTRFQDLNFTPDFPSAAQMAAAMVAADPGIRVDGVISLDPVALAHLLGAIGPVHVDAAGVDRTLTRANAVDILLNELYLTEPPEAQDAFFQAAARAVFSKVTAGAGKPIDLVRALADGARQGRVLVWSRDEAEERKLSAVRVGGDLPHNTTGSPQVGVYLNDATASKMEYYLDLDADVSATRCSPQGRQGLSARVSMRSTTPADAATLPSYVTGSGRYVARGTMQFNLRVYGPVDGKITALTVGGRRATIAGGTHDRRPVAVVAVKLRPGEELTVEATLETGPRQDVAPVLSMTPGVQDRPTRVEAASACAR